MKHNIWIRAIDPNSMTPTVKITLPADIDVVMEKIKLASDSGRLECHVVDFDFPCRIDYHASEMSILALNEVVRLLDEECDLPRRHKIALLKVVDMDNLEKVKEIITKEQYMFIDDVFSPQDLADEAFKLDGFEIPLFEGFEEDTERILEWMDVNAGIIDWHGIGSLMVDIHGWNIVQFNDEGEFYGIAVKLT